MPEDQKPEQPASPEPGAAPERAAVPEKPAVPEKAAAPEKAKKQKAASGRPNRAERRAARVTPRRWPKVAAGTATALLAVGMVAAGTVLPGTNATAQLTAGVQVLPAGDLVANCVGPTQLLSGSSAGADPEFSAASSTTKTQLSAVVLSNAEGVLPGSRIEKLAANPTPLSTIAQVPDTGAAAPAPAAVPGAAKVRAAVVQDVNENAATVLRALPVAGQVSQGAGAVVVSAGDGDLKGLAAATCQVPSNDLWLAGASTTVGHTAVLTLANSTKSPATVELELFGAAGPISAPGGKGIVVAPGSSRSVVLSGLAPNQELLTVHVKSAGGAVSAVIQQSVLRGLTPGGVDFLAPVQAPDTTQTIPGVRVQDPVQAGKISAQPGYSDASAALQVTVPGGTDAVVEVKAFGAAGQIALPNGGVFTARAGKVSELSLAGMAQDTYSLSVSADSPVTAAVRLVNSTKPGAAVDLAYAPATRRLGANHLVPLPGGVTSSLVFTAPTGPATVSLVPVSVSGVLGAPTTVELKPGMTAAVDAASTLGTGAAAVLVSAAGEPVYGSQLLGTNGSANVAVLAISATPEDSQKLAITTRY